MGNLFVIEKDGKKRKASTVICSNCRQEFLKADKQIKKTQLRGQNHFCSRECMYESHKKRVPVECAFCNKAFEKTPSSLNNSKSGLYFCSRECKDSAQQIYNSENTVFDILPSHYGTRSTISKSNYRERALKEYGTSCQRCGFEGDLAAITVHHKDYNRNNNLIENLEVLCGNCHMIEHYGKK